MIGKTNYIVTSLSLLLVSTLTADAQTTIDDGMQYKRSSLAVINIRHPKYAYNKEIEFVLSTTSGPERFNDHTLKVRSVIFSNEKKDQEDNIRMFIDQNQLGRRLVSKWFDHTKNSGFDMNLVRERGLYNASAADLALAANSVRGHALLEDAGENLIGNTYVMFNDIRYVDRSTTWNTIKEIAMAVTAIAAGVVTGNADVMALMADKNVAGASTNWLYGSLTDNIKGFAVNMTSYLYRLKWDTKTADEFYNLYYTDNNNIDQNKIAAYNKSDIFEMEYVGKIENKSSTTVLSGVKTNEELIKKVLVRTLDQNLADLQHEFEDFRIKAPLLSAEPIRVQIGMKEDVTDKSKFEVLEVITDEKGCTKYKRAGVIKPVVGKIWDNRFMAVEEGAENASLGFTTFEKVSGGDFYPGMLIREIR